MAFSRKMKTVILLFSFLFFSSFLFLDAQDYSLPEVQKVLRAIEKILSEQSGRNEISLKKIIITEKELNSYIAYRIEKENEEIMRELRLKLFKGNKIEGKILIDLRGQRIPVFFRPQMNLYFEAIVHVKNGYVRFDIKELFLEGQPIQPMILDLIISIASKLENEEPISMKDWFELPYGIKDIKTHPAKASFYY